MNVLFCASEAFPLVKTGGLGDVCGSLPKALHELGHDVRLILPAYPAVMERAGELHVDPLAVADPEHGVVESLRAGITGSRRRRRRIPLTLEEPEAVAFLRVIDADREHVRPTLVGLSASSSKPRKNASARP